MDLYKNRIVVGVPSYNGTLSKVTTRSLTDLINYENYNTGIGKEGFEFDIRICNNLPTAQARNKTITGTDAVKKEYVFQEKFYLSLDADIGFSVEQLVYLIGLDLNIIGIPYKFRQPKNSAGNLQKKLVCGFWDTVQGAGYLNKETVLNDLDTTNKDNAEIITVDWIGAGFLLIKNTVINKIGFPYFTNRIIENKKDGTVMTAGEDISFCLAARENGFAVNCLLNERVEHNDE